MLRVKCKLSGLVSPIGLLSENMRVSWWSSELIYTLIPTILYRIVYCMYFQVYIRRYSPPVLLSTDRRSTVMSSSQDSVTMSSMLSCRASITTRPGSNVEPCSTSSSCHVFPSILNDANEKGAYCEHGAVGVNVCRVSELLEIFWRVLPKCTL